MIGAYLYAFSDTHRLEILAPGMCKPDDPEEVLAAITSFVSAGMLAPSLAGTEAAFLASHAAKKKTAGGAMVRKAKNHRS